MTVPQSADSQVESELAELEGSVRRCKDMNELERKVLALQVRMNSALSDDSEKLVAKYHVERLHRRTRTLLADIRARRPFKKFRFVRQPRREEQEKTAVENEEKGRGSIAASSATAVVPAVPNTVVSNKKGESLQITVDDGNDVDLAELRNCVVTVKGIVGVLHVRNVLSSVIVVADKIGGSCLLHDSQDSVFEFANLQQLRIHTSTACLFRVHIASGPIIEDCKEIFFAPVDKNTSSVTNMNDNNSTAVKMVEGAANKKGSTASVNRWDDVKDFKWLRREKSPNWDILPEVDAAAFAAWIGEALKTGDEKPFSDADNRWQGWIEMRRKEVRETLPVASRTLEPAVAPPEVTSRDNSGSNGNTNTANEDDSEDEI